MKKQNKQEYIASMHRMGKTGAFIIILVMLAMPTIIGLYFNAMPNFKNVLQGAIGLLAVFVPVAISEVISYTPILGSSIYLTLITGNVMNLKLPVANNAMNLLDIESGSEEADVVSSISVCISTFVTLVIIALGVLLMIPLQGFLTQPSIQIATSNIIPALFGALILGSLSSSVGGGVKAKGRLKGAILPVVIVAAITLLDKYVLHIGIMSMFQGFIILLILPVAYFGTKWLYKKGHIQVTTPEDTKSES